MLFCYADLLFMCPQRSLFALVIAALLALAGCGTPGAPMPPSLQLPKAVDDLAVLRKGGRVILSWTQPAQTTDRQNIRRPGVTRVCRSAGTLPVERCTSVVAELTPQQIAQFTVKSQKPKVVFQQPLAADNNTLFSTFSVEVLNDRGRSAGLSNQVSVPTVTTLPAPTDLRAEVGPEGVTLKWTGVATETAPDVPGVRYSYELLRKVENSGNFIAVLETPLNGPQTVVTDRSFEWETTYDYRVIALTHLTALGRDIDVEGDDSATIRVVLHDTFAPAQPSGLQAVFSGVGQQPFIDLSWAPNTESDLAGYNIYRHEGDSAACEDEQRSGESAGIPRQPSAARPHLLVLGISHRSAQ